MSKCAMVTLTVFLGLLEGLRASCFKEYNVWQQRCDVEARVETGWLCGRIFMADNGARFASFRGVPYGKPPLGKRRFQELEPPDPWQFLLDATQNAAACPQADMFFGRLPLQLKGMSEDCIYLNLHVPYDALLQAQRQPRRRCTLPILVFIHGGAFQSGAGLTDLYGPQYFMTNKCIVITFNYRINIFGFLSLNTIKIPGNQAFRDMITLLKWVQRNACFFGGDRDNVTLMGQSAGGSSAHILSMSNAARGLFKKIIMMSGVAFPSYFTSSPEYAAGVTKQFLQLAGINETDPELIHQRLTEMPLLELMQANTALQLLTGVVSFNPVVETEFPGVTRIIHKDPITLMSEGCGNEFPALISYTDNEAATLRWYMIKKGFQRLVESNNIALVSPRLIYSLPNSELVKIANNIDKQYFNGSYTLDNFIHYITDAYFKYPALKVAEWRANLGGKTYMYQFAYDFPYSVVKEAHWIDYKGSAHMDDLMCAFRANSLINDCDHFYPPKNSDDAMKYNMVQIITNFMRCSSPSCSNDSWRAVSKGGLQYNLITEPYAVHMAGPSAAERTMLHFFDSQDAQVRDLSAQMRSISTG